MCVLTNPLLFWLDSHINMISNVTLTPAGPRQASLNWIAVIGALLSTRSCKLLSKIMETLRRSNSRNEKNPSGIRDCKEKLNDEQNYQISTWKSYVKLDGIETKKCFYSPRLMLGFWTHFWETLKSEMPRILFEHLLLNVRISLLLVLLENGKL